MPSKETVKMLGVVVIGVLLYDMVAKPLVKKVKDSMTAKPTAKV